jgi:tRNA (guanine-N7-)-methyltransferase
VSVFVLRSILKPIDFNEMFPRSAPLEVELGSGDGSFLVAWAGAHPECNYLGVERLLGRANKMMRKAGRAGLVNLQGVRIESSYFLQYLLPEHSAEALHIYFPDPWPKKRHRRHRLINERFPELAKRAVASGGSVYLRTDDRDYFEQMQSVFANVPKLFSLFETPAELQGVMTDFERQFNAQGIPTLRAAYRRA